ncbi:putative prophage antirepressor [Haemophilus influenzae]|uniref:KilA-N domain-containing protein n=6 Tax=Haemophilus influenzae TaxID=727 RepID=UPI0005AED795|nr:KilA-N domain-containing protein [Haemophilus influenzae]AXP54906.1 KilA-N domain-containing protein [Haemophilus influenzae]AXP76427.1 KilA-N domain-containing protein [Haemophilus influenzae]MCK8845982.1 KilA-N domain-containing protein [Haemophilus influenzae]MCK8938224.1 KilA-N domain-containing protein [Haemophilus influenzae]MCK8980449.1 KilA-N domain-containing protein [Haemophilus influenzae]
MSNLAILDTSIRQLDNLFSLTDLHKASGGEKHKPVLFLRLDQTKDLISEIENDKVQICTLPVKTVRGGKNPSTYACEELVLAYAMWISPKFHLIVLRAFLAMHKSESQNANPIQPLADEPLNLLVQAYHFLYQASDLRTKVQPTFIGIDIDRHFGRHYLHNLGKPLSQCMENIQAYIHASAERLMFVQGMASLLETPTAKKAVFK